MSDLLQIGASGTKAYSRALATIGENIVNAETPGFSRRNIVLKESGLGASTNALYLDKVQFGGLDDVSIGRAWDSYRAADARMAGAAAGRSDARVRWLSALESSLNDGATGVGQSVTAVFTAGETLASDPNNSFARKAFLQNIETAAGAFRTTADALTRTSDSISAEATTTVSSINANIDALTKLNVQLRRAVPGTSAAAQLSDERDRLLDELSDQIEIDVTIGDDNTASVTLPNSGGLILVDNKGVAPGMLSVGQSSNGRLSLSLFTQGDNHAIGVTSGALAGMVESAGIVADRLDQLNEMAANFATQLNGWSAAGVDQNGDAGTDLLSFDPAKAAATIGPAIANRDPATVAAATQVVNADGTTTTTANGNMLALSTVRGSGGTEKAWSTMVGAQAQMLASAKSEQATSSARKDGAYATRDDIIGVDMDYEASELMRFQQAYTGAAKIIQVARETIQTIMDVL